MSTCSFRIGQTILCKVDSAIFGLTEGKTYKVTQTMEDEQWYVRVLCDDKVYRRVRAFRFVHQSQKEFTDEEYERLLV